MDEGYVYVLHDQAQNKFYVGRTAQEVDARIYQHVQQAWTGSRTPLSRAIRSSGAEHIYLVRVDVENLRDLPTREKQLIQEFHSAYPNGYNVVGAGKGARPPDPNAKRKLKKFESLIIEAYQAGRSFDELANFYNVAIGTIRTVLLRHGVPRRGPGRRKRSV